MNYPSVPTDHVIIRVKITEYGIEWIFNQFSEQIIGWENLRW